MAQRLIDDVSEGSPESKLLALINNFANSSFDVNAKADDSGNTLLHIACNVGSRNAEHKILG